MLMNKVPMKRVTLKSLQNRSLVLLRFMIAFGLGYVCADLMSETLAILLLNMLEKAEAIFLGAFISIIFYVVFVLICFCIQSFIRMSMLSAFLFSLLFFSSRILS